MGIIGNRLEIYSADNPFPGASEHDRDGILTPEEIIKLKQDLLADVDNPLHNRVAYVASFIVSGILIGSYLLDERKRSDPSICYASNAPQDIEGHITHASQLGAYWAVNILRFCQLPDDQWPAGATSPSSIASWFEDMNEAEAAKGKPTPEELFDIQTAKIMSVEERKALGLDEVSIIECEESGLRYSLKAGLREIRLSEPYLEAPQVRELLGIDELGEFVDDGTLLAYEDHGMYLFPVFQFDASTRQPNETVSTVNAMLGSPKDALGVLDWWRRPNTRNIDNATPKSLIGTDTEFVAINLAEAFLQDSKSDSF